MVHRLMHFALAVRHRKHLILLPLVLCCLLGGLYYATATRYYMAQAELELELGNEMLGSNPLAPQSNWVQKLTNQSEIIRCSRVIQGALDRLSGKELVDFAGAPRETWEEIVEKNLWVGTPPRSSIMEVKYVSKDRGDAVLVLDSVLSSYQEFTEAKSNSQDSEVIQLFRTELVGVDTKLRELESQRLDILNESGGLEISPDGKIDGPAMERVATLNQELLEARSRCGELDVVLDEVRSASRNGIELSVLLPALERTLGIETVRGIRETLGDSDYHSRIRGDLEKQLREDRAEWESMRGRGLGQAHPEVVAKAQRMRDTEQKLGEYKQRLTKLGPVLLFTVEQQLREAKEIEAVRDASYETARNEAASLTIQLSQLSQVSSDIDFNRKLRDDILAKSSSLEMGVKNEEGDVRINPIAAPAALDKPVSPRLGRTGILAVAIGLGLGLALVYLIDLLDDRFRSVEELQMLLNVPVLAMVRHLEPDDATGIEAVRTHTVPNASECEAFRTLRTALSLAEHETNQIVVTSPEPGDGKTTMLANLAVSYAQAGKRTLLIDADLRRPGLTAMMGMKGVEGLCTALRSDGEVTDMAKAHIRPSGLEGLDVLPSGPRPTNPAELLGSNRFSEFLAWAESVYDQVLVDSPPSLATSDTAVIGRIVDGVVLVVQPGKNRRRMVMRCIESLAALKITLIGIVVNRVDSNQDGYYGYYGYDYEYGGKSPEEEEEEDGGAQVEREASPEVPLGAPHWNHPGAPAPIIPRRIA